MEERSMHLFDYLSVLKRRRWWLITPIALGLLVGVALVLTLPREYRSYTTLAVTSPNMTTDLVKSSPADMAERMRAISHELLSRPVLEQVVRDEDLADAASMDGAIADIRGRSAVSLPKTLSSNSRSGPDTFLVTYTGRTPDVTQRDHQPPRQRRSSTSTRSCARPGPRTRRRFWPRSSVRAGSASRPSRSGSGR